jgi:hypothetical protein
MAEWDPTLLTVLTDEELLKLHRQVLRSINMATFQHNHLRYTCHMPKLANRWQLHAVRLLGHCDLIETELLKRGER